MYKDILYFKPGPPPGWVPGSIKNPLDDCFYIKTDSPNIVKVAGVHRQAIGADIGWAFHSGFPQGLTSLKDLKAVIPEVKATDAALERIQYLKQVPDLLESLGTVNSREHTFKLPPFQHQAQALEYMLHYRRLALVLDMGLGKTFIALLYAEIMKHRLVVLCPKIALSNWARETEKFTNLKPVVYRGTPKQREQLRYDFTQGKDKDWDVLITNYEALTPSFKPRSKIKEVLNKEDLAFFRDIDYSCFVLDEASRILGHKSTRGQAIASLADKVDHRYLLSGTLSQGKPLDVFTPFKIMDASILGGNYYQVRSQYCVFSKFNKHQILKYKNLDQLKAKIDPHMLCMTKDDELELPERLLSRKYYDLSDEQLELYNAVVSQERIALPTREQPNGEVRCPILVIKITKLLQILSGFIQLSPERDYTKCNECSNLLVCMCLKPDQATDTLLEFEVFPWSDRCKLHDPMNPVRKPTPEIHYLKTNPKLDLLDDVMESVGVYNRPTPEKMIIWAQFRTDLAQIKRLLERKKVKFVTPEDKDSDHVFQTNSQVAVYLGQISQGIAITLTEAAYTFYYSHTMVLDHRDQSMDRNYRIGQNRPVFVMDVVAPGTVEHTLLRLLEKKCDVKQFMQQNRICDTCSKSVKCFENMIQPYSEQCIYYGQRKEAEERLVISVDEI